MKSFNRIILAISIIFTLFGSNTHCMWQSIRARATQAVRSLRMGTHNVQRTAVKNTPYFTPKITSWPKFSVRLGAIAGAGLATASIGTVYAQGNIPAFNKKDLQKHALDFHGFEAQQAKYIDQAIRHITTQDPEEIEAIIYVLNLYQNHAAQKLMPAINQEFSNIHPSILKEILVYHSDATQNYLTNLSCNNNGHLFKLLAHLKAENEQSMATPSDISQQLNNNYDWKFTNHNQEKISFIDLLCQNPKAISVDTFNQIYEFLGGCNEDRKYAWKGDHRSALAQKLQEAAKEYYKPNPNTMIELFFGTKKTDSLVQEPYCIYTNHKEFRNFYLHEKLIFITKNINEVSTQNLELFWQHCINYMSYNYPVESKRFFDALEKKFGEFPFEEGQENIVDQLLTNEHKLPSFVLRCPKSYAAKSHSEKHFCDNISSVLCSLVQYENWKEKQTQQMFKNALAQEREEVTKGNYVFYHGRKPEWDFISDFYKQTHNLTVSDDKRVDETYTFLRFDQSTSRFDGKQTIGATDALFLNCPLFGNSKCFGNSSAQLVLRNHDWSLDKHKAFTPEVILSQFKQEKLYKKYQDEINKLKELHEKANPLKVGNLLMLVLDGQNANRIYPVNYSANREYAALLKNGEKTFEAKKIAQACKEGTLKDSDKIELVLPLTKDYALDPKGGLKIHNFRAGDPAGWKEYEAARDQLFAKMKTDLEAEVS